MDARVMVLALLVTLPALAETPVFRWTDAQGQVHYGDQPGKGADATWLNAPPPAPQAPPTPPVPAPPATAGSRLDGWFCKSLRGEVEIFERRFVYLIANPWLPNRDKLLAENRASYQEAVRGVAENKCGN